MLVGNDLVLIDAARANIGRRRMRGWLDGNCDALQEAAAAKRPVT